MRSRGSSSWLRAWPYALCAVAGAGLFIPALAAGRLADDFVLERTVSRVTGPFWPFGHNDLGQGSGNFYRPVWVLFNAAVHQVSNQAEFAHGVNLVLFAILCLEVGMLLRRLVSRPAAILGTLTFACFPSHGESVAWISGNTDLLAGVLGVGAVLSASRRPGSDRWVALAAVLAAAAVLSKEVAVVVPALAALTIWASGAGEPARRAYRPVWPMLALVALALLVRTIELHGIGGYAGSPLTA